MAWSDYQYDRRNYHKLYDGRIKERAIASYGGKCVCCGETRLEFLTMDHMYGGGKWHIKEIRMSIYRWLRKYAYSSPGFRVLCYNCNMCLGRFGYCAHNNSQIHNHVETEIWIWKSTRKNGLDTEECIRRKLSQFEQESLISTIHSYSYVCFVEQGKDGKKFAITYPDGLGYSLDKIYSSN